MLRRPMLLALALLLAVSVPHVRAQGDDDPFSDANQAKAVQAKAQKPSSAAQELSRRIAFDAKFEPSQAKPGDVVKLVVTGTPAKDCYTYPATKRTAEQSETVVTRLAYAGADGLKPLWPMQETEPEYHLTLNLELKNALEFAHAKPFTWTQEFLVDPATKPGKQEVTVKVRLQVCNKSSCLPGDYAPFSAAIEIAGAPATPNQATLDRLKGPPAVAVVTPPAGELQKVMGGGGVASVPGKTSTGAPPVDFNDLWRLLSFAALSAILMLLTPCVFPMIPITVNFFLKQSEKEHHKPFMMASAYSGTIIVMLTVVILLLGNFVIMLASNTLFNLALGLVLIVFALSLFGMYEIELPSFLARYTSSREGQGGMIGTVFMAMTFTITSFTCTGPFLGLMLSSLASSQPPLLNLVLAAIVYSTTFAAPFFLLAMFPSLLKKLPKSGGWLNVVKVVMGFLELGAALKFLSNADFTYHGIPRLFNYDTVLSAWIALSIACSLYLLGFYRLPHDDKEETIAVPRMILATIFLGLAVYLAPAMLGIRPAGVVGENLVAFLPLRTGHDNDGFRAGGGGGESSHKSWHFDYQDAYDDAIKNNKLIFIDFTGVTCTNCRDNESNVFPVPDVKAELKNLVKLSLYVDIVPDPKLTPAQASAQAARNMKWQDKLADLTLPTYLVFRPALDTPFDADGNPKGTILSVTNGKIFDVPAFVAALRAAQTTPAVAKAVP